eukprot:NODE_435_length_8649_cov_0.394386.p3 type:complete len:494 gc:universal NODE_435_length_8649_cov_0.394386:7309-5828(-)
MNLNFLFETNVMIKMKKTRLNLKFIGLTMIAMSGLTALILVNKKSTIKPLDKFNSEIDSFTPQFKEHGVWHLYKYNKNLVDARLPIPEQLFEHPDSSNFENVNMKRVKQSLDEFVSISSFFPNSPGSGSGLVVCAHDGVRIELLAMITYIRNYSKMPIEVFHADDFDKQNQKLFSKFTDLKFIDLKNTDLFLTRQSTIDSRKYYLKPLAMLSTSFEDVIYLDSDAFPLLHLDDNILEKSLKHLETVDMYLFRDYWMMPDTNPIYSLFKNGYYAQRQVDSGIVIYKKSKVINVLLLSYSISQESYFDALFFGDKDTFWFANAYLTYNNHIHTRVYVNSEMVGYISDTIHDIGMLHTIQGKPAFAHFNGIKFVLDHWKDYGIDVLELSFGKMTGLMLKSESNTFDDTYTQQYKSYRSGYRNVDDKHHEMIDIHGDLLFKFYKLAYAKANDQNKAFYFIIKWGLYFILSIASTLGALRLFVIMIGTRRRYKVSKYN